MDTPRYPQTPPDGDDGDRERYASMHPECPDLNALGPNRGEAMLRAEAAGVAEENARERARYDHLNRVEEAQQERRATTRRRFLVGSALTGTALATSSFVSSQVSFGETANEGTFIQVFLQGALDGLSLLAPANSTLLQEVRPELVLPERDSLSLGSGFALNSAFAPLQKYLKLDELAFVHGVSDPDISRSHFQAQDFCELGGLPTQSSSGRGWLDSLVEQLGPGTTFRSVGVGSTLSRSLVGTQGSLAMNNLESLRINGDEKFAAPTEDAIRTMFTGVDHPVKKTVASGLSALETASKLTEEEYTPRAGVEYEDEVGLAFQEIARLIKGDAGVRVASVNMGGYDTHEAQGTNEGHLYDLLNQLAKALRAFFDDLGSARKNVTVMVISEFGRRVEANGSGTDHGHGGVATILTGKKVAAPLLGKWGGLDELDQDDVPEYNNILDLYGSVTQSQFGLSDAEIKKLFPDHDFSPISVMR